MKNSSRDIQVMGIVNLTDDSYYGASRHLAEDGRVCTDKVLTTIGSMLEEGASIIDIGACSTRPGSQAVGAEEEWNRLSTVLPAIRQDFPEVRISIDTYHSSVVERVFETIGDFIVNDISAGEDDPQMLATVGRLGLEYVAMHKRGTPATMQSLCDYSDVVEDVKRYFLDFAGKAAAAGIRRWILDPGFGFAKTIEQNYQLMAGLPTLGDLGYPILVGISRKSMIYRLLDITPEEALPQTCALHMAALERGADILRVHDVAEAVRTVRIYKALNN